MMGADDQTLESLPLPEGGDMDTMNADTSSFNLMPPPSHLSFLVSQPGGTTLTARMNIAAISDVGCVRTNNEDTFGHDPVSKIYIVCDGMGGMEAGEVASSIACNTAISIFAAQPVQTPLELRLETAITAANDAVYRASRSSEKQGMGSTLVAAAVSGSNLLIGNVGDSRAYLFQNKVGKQITRDHSYVNELVNSGTIRAEDIPNLQLDHYASVITRAIGVAREVKPDFFQIDLQDGDVILLASDGLTRYVEDVRLPELIDGEDLEGSCHCLINEAKAAGGADNITCFLLHYGTIAEVETPSEVPSVIEGTAPDDSAT